MTLNDLRLNVSGQSTRAFFFIPLIKISKSNFVISSTALSSLTTTLTRLALDLFGNLEASFVSFASSSQLGDKFCLWLRVGFK